MKRDSPVPTPKLMPAAAKENMGALLPLLHKGRLVLEDSQ
eukprot:CAMPEP_0168416840 /NCGR_PEP_ID=MMETSP0228-20121227/30943_1 /TAXON_ID=133427 /ORGANISM="Protoceratium reticulatum, Strain CCCM 535 (=CCMP 1889)" /LENGTH=39 /DNA_ID= /DNA_START= /DNA_END= /DNA_ORIENTATION=